MRFFRLAALVLLIPALPASAEEKITHRILAADKGHVAIVNTKGEVEWEYANNAECHDLWLLANGNVLRATGPATAAEVSPDKKIPWSHTAKPTNAKARVAVHDLQRLV